MKIFLPLVAAFVLAAFTPASTDTRQIAARHTAILAVTDSALAAITRGDMVALTDLMTPEALTMSIRDSARYAVRTRAQERARTMTGVVERGFRPTVHVSGPLAVVWLPYDLYVKGNWSHCGIDAFTLVQNGGVWKIAMLAWSVEQPPACDRHPDGPPRD